MSIRLVIGPRGGRLSLSCRYRDGLFLRLAGFLRRPQANHHELGRLTVLRHRPTSWKLALHRQAWDPGASCGPSWTATGFWGFLGGLTISPCLPDPAQGPPFCTYLRTHGRFRLTKTPSFDCVISPCSTNLAMATAAPICASIPNTAIDHKACHKMRHTGLVALPEASRVNCGATRSEPTQHQQTKILAEAALEHYCR